jgi:hypothetical protein
MLADPTDFVLLCEPGKLRDNGIPPLIDAVGGVGGVKAMTMRAVVHCGQSTAVRRHVWHWNATGANVISHDRDDGTKVLRRPRWETRARETARWS